MLPALPPLLAQPIKEELGLPAQPSPNILDLTGVGVITSQPPCTLYIQPSPPTSRDS